MAFLSRIRARPLPARRAPSLEPLARPSRLLGDCPRGTPGCIYADCSSTAGRSCYGADAPIHLDMFTPEELEFGLSGEEAAMLREANRECEEDSR